MGYGLSVFLITAKDARILGTKDFDLCEEVLEAMAERLDEYEQMLDPDDDNAISHRAALREIFAGSISQSDSASAYGWAYELYCSSMGDRLTKIEMGPHCGGPAPG